MGGWRFRKRIKIAPGITLNLSHRSTGLTIGGKWARVTLNSRGTVTKSVSLPGTGLYWSETDRLTLPTESSYPSEVKNSIIAGNPSIPGTSQYSLFGQPTGYILGSLGLLVGIAILFFWSPGRPTASIRASTATPIIRATPTHAYRTAMTPRARVLILPTVAPTSTPSMQWAVVTATSLNVRDGPNLNAAVTGQLPRGTCLPIIETAPGWLRLHQANGQTGWSSADYLVRMPICP